MSGLRRIAKAYGGIILQGKQYVWDYVADDCVPEHEMPTGSERRKASERKRWAAVKESLTAQTANEAPEKP